MIILLLILGVVAGTAAGFFGIGGGLLFSPILFTLFNSLGVESPVAWAIGTSLFCTFTAALSSTIQQQRNKNIYWREGFLTGCFGAVGVFLGKQIATSPYYTNDVFVSFFIILLIFVAILFYRKSQSNVTLQVSGEKMGLLKISNAGGLGGIVASMAGVGGGVVLVPVMNLWYRIPIARTVSISSLAIVIISFSGWIQYAFLADADGGISPYTLGYVDFGTSLPLIIGAFFGGFAGVKLSEKASASNVQGGFSILVIVVALSLIYNII
jgi:uncharacterized protein